MTSPRRSANKVDLPAPLGPTNLIRSPRLTWSETSSNSARPAKDFESCETVSIAESAQFPPVRCPAQPLLRRKSNEGGPSRPDTALCQDRHFFSVHGNGDYDWSAVGNKC